MRIHKSIIIDYFHRDSPTKVSGWSDVWIGINEKEQDEIIEEMKSSDKQYLDEFEFFKDKDA